MFYVNIVANLEQIFQQVAITINMLQAMLKNLNANPVKKCLETKTF